MQPPQRPRAGQPTAMATHHRRQQRHPAARASDVSRAATAPFLPLPMLALPTLLALLALAFAFQLSAVHASDGLESRPLMQPLSSSLMKAEDERAAAGSSAGSAWSSLPSSFVKRSGSRLTLDGKPFHFLGCNAYQFVDDWRFDRSRIPRLMSMMQRHGLRVVRTWAYATRLPYDAGNGQLGYDEEAFRGLDYVVQQARVHNLRLVLAMGNLWPAFVGPERFLSVARAGQRYSGGDKGDVYDFYSYAPARDVYKRWLNRVLS